MALRSLMKGKELRTAQKSLEEARAKMEALKTREAELAQSIEEAETEDERAAVQEAVDAFETERAEAEKAVTDLEAEVDKLERELAEIENTPAETKTEEPEKRAAEPQKETRTMMKRWKEMNYEERSAFVQRDEMQAFLGEVRSAIAERRAISNAGYLVPRVLIGLLKESIEDYSKLYNRVFLKSVPGEGRVTIEGAIPEAVWTEACANLNELDLSFSKVEVDGYKVGGYFKVCNATLEDSDVDLASELISALGQAIGLALDAAIVFGTGTKMPVGIVTALKAVTSTPNVVSHANTVTGKSLIEALIDDAAKITSKYGSDLIWIMNKKTWLKIKKNMMNVDANGLYVAGNQLPIIGGDIIELGFMPDDVIVGGYADLYLLAERAGTKIGTSEHAFWVADQTGFKGTARYDGKVLDTNGFVAIGINGADGDDMVHTFPQDGANL